MTADGTGDEKIKPHREIKGEVEQKFRDILSEHGACCLRDDDVVLPPFIIRPSDTSDSDEECEEVGDDDGPLERDELDTDGIDDESAESGSDRDPELVGDNGQWAVVDEQRT